MAVLLKRFCNSEALPPDRAGLQQAVLRQGLSNTIECLVLQTLKQLHPNLQYGKV